MELVMNGMTELNEEEMMLVDGGYHAATEAGSSSSSSRFSHDWDAGLNTGGFSYSYDDETGTHNVSCGFGVGTSTISW